ncbi:E3 ubiquitin-protein ligase ORTHRUS 2 [Apostasia shenzhenica]|uniref:RING-type E3 ubiquitin transferase n=1 Tax=Apostasia shenzhenica TaxID=1088818 RepID=A0A2I0AGY2_9ASPA|nr:E3 ubiquitin-protein ligase ORTHRUS 2 [Apostasia shenzhenica]
MSPAVDLPCDGDGVCMACKNKPSELETMTCRTCATPWHVECLSRPPETLALAADWQCPDCCLPAEGALSDIAASGAGSGGALEDLIASIRAIEADESLTEQEKARRRQELMSRGAGKEKGQEEEEEDREKQNGDGANDVLGLLDEKFNCSFCMQLPERPVTTPCGHNFCLKCFQKWLGQGKHTCAKCRAPIPPKMVSQPRINSALVVAIRMAKTVKPVPGNKTTVYHYICNENRPEKAFTTERAKKSGKANACSGQIFVTVPPDHFGPILAEHDPKRNKGVLVGESWEDRMECRQWGAHLPHVAGIAGQSGYGAQSVALSGGYEDDEDHGEWFLYTGSGGRDLSGNKRTNKDQSFDQKFDKMNEALRVSCRKGYPVRVVRSHKEKRSAYAPETGVRYDGIYRIEKCWRKVGIQGFKVCRYLFVRCDNEPAPWTSDENGDRPRPLPEIKELKRATDTTERKERPAWDYNEKDGWVWTKPPPHSRKILASGDVEENKSGRKRRLKSTNVRERLLKEFKCEICGKVMTFPLTTPCAHNFCKKCLLDSYDDQSFIRERTSGGRTLRAQKIVKKCPSCTTDISDFLQNPQVNRELMDLIESLQQKIREENLDADEEASDERENNDEKVDTKEKNDGAGEEDSDGIDAEDGDGVGEKCHTVGRKEEANCFSSESGQNLQKAQKRLMGVSSAE